MPWQDRLREAAYTSPNGTRIVFIYEDVGRTFDKKTAAFEFPDADGTYVQDLGRSGRRFPLRLIFSGDDHDQQADAFDEALQETGVGKLEHPRYGVFDVVPFGAVNQRDDLKTAANQTVFEVTFWETITLIYPINQGDPAADVLSALSEYNSTAAGSLSGSVDLTSAIQRVTFKNTVTRLLDSARSFLEPVAELQANVQRQFDNLVDGINEGIDVLIGDPLTLAFQISQTLQAPARAAENIAARLDAYGDLFESIISGDGAQVTQSTTRGTEANTFYTKDLYAAGALSGSVLSLVNGSFKTKPEAIEAADGLLSRFESFTGWRDNRADELGLIDTGESYQQIQEAVAIAAGFLVAISFSLKQERRVTLTRARTIIDLAAELYSDVDDSLDYLISTNNLTGSEILEIPKGREIVYYV